MSEKGQIVQAFSGAATTYEQAAVAQKVIAARMADKVMKLPLPSAPRILEIGCGTGFLGRLLLERIEGGTWTLSDISPAMIERCRENIADSRVSWHVMDGEAPDLPPQSFDLIVSSLAVQWFSDLPAALKRLQALLSQQGHLIFVTLGVDSFIEWRTAHQDLGLSCGLRTFPAHLPDFAHETEEKIAFRQDDAFSFARNFKEIGAQTPDPGHTALSPSQFRALGRALGTDFEVTYHLLYGYCGGV